MAVLPPQFGIAILVGAIGAIGLVVVTWRHPGIALIALVIGLPFQQLILARAFAWGVDMRVLGMARFWKEAVLLLLVLKCVSGSLKVSRLERFALLYVAVIVAYTIIPIGPNTLYIRTVAARGLASFVIVFIVARNLRLPEETAKRVEGALLLVGVILACLAFWNHFEPESWTRWIESTRLLDYRATLVEEYLLADPVTWTTVGGRAFVRAGSLLTYLSLPYFLAIPVSIALARGFSGRINRFVVIPGLLCTAGILVTISRSAIMLAPVVAILALSLARRRVRIGVVVAVIAVVLIPVMSALDLTEHLATGFDTRDDSTSLHIDRLDASNERLWERPLGSGMGTSAETAQRFEVRGGITNESWYYQIGTDTGFLGMVSYILFVIVVLYQLATEARRGSTTALGAFCALAWISLGGLVLHTLSDVVTAWSMFMLAGLALRNRSDQHPETSEAEDSGEGSEARSGQLRSVIAV